MPVAGVSAGCHSVTMPCVPSPQRVQPSQGALQAAFPRRPPQPRQVPVSVNVNAGAGAAFGGAAHLVVEEVALDVFPSTQPLLGSPQALHVGQPKLLQQILIRRPAAGGPGRAGWLGVLGWGGGDEPPCLGARRRAPCTKRDR